MNLMLGVCPSTYGNISNVTITKNTFYMNNVSPIMNKEIVRVGGVLDTTNYPFVLSNITLEENEIIGNLANSKAIVVKKEETNGASVKIAKNSIKNTGESSENSYGIIASGPNIVIENEVEGMETAYVLDEETKFQEDAIDSSSSDDSASSNLSQDDNKGNSSQESNSGETVNSENVTNNMSQTVETQGNTSEEGCSGGEKQANSKSSDKLKLKLKRKKSAITLKWKRVSSAKGYVIYGARKGKKLKKIKTIKKGTITSWTHKKLKSKKTYQYVIKAYKIKKGKKIWIATSKTCSAKTK